MGRYFIDFQDGNEFFQDDHGSNLDTVEMAQQEVAHLVSLRAYDARPASEDCELIATVRDESGAALHRAMLTIRLERLDQGAFTSAPPDTPTHFPAAADLGAPAPPT